MNQERLRDAAQHKKGRGHLTSKTLGGVVYTQAQSDVHLINLWWWLAASE